MSRVEERDRNSAGNSDGGNVEVCIHMKGVRFRKIFVTVWMMGVLLCTGLYAGAAETEALSERTAYEGTGSAGAVDAEGTEPETEALSGEPASTGAEADGVLADFTQEERERNGEFGVLKVGYVSDRNPVSFKNKEGEFDGVSRKIFDRLQEISGLQFEYVALPSGPVTYDYLLGEGFDFVTSVEYNEENKKARGILISHPYLTSKKVVVGRQDLVFDANANLSVAVSTGSQTLKKVMAAMYPNFELIDFDTMEDCFDAVNDGKADILIQNQFVAERYLYKPEYEKLIVVPVIGMDDELCFSAVTPLEETEGEEWDRCEELLNEIDRAIALLTEDEVTNYVIEGTMENIYDLTYGDLFYRYRYALLVLAAAFVLVLVMIAMIARYRLRTADAQAEAKAKGNFLSTMSHEIRTPLNGMIGLNYLMEQNLDDHQKMKDYLRQSSATAKYLQSLINDILDMSKLEMNKMELVSSPFSLKDALAVIETIERSRMADKEIDFRMDMDVPHPFIVGDEVRLEQIILNIIDNAYKFTPAGGSVRVQVRQTPSGDGKASTEIKVSDTGWGISEEFQQKIFHSFTQERNTVSKGNQGTGLGMSISYLLAELMGGSLSVESKLGHGSCFTFSFPAEIVQEDLRTGRQETETRAGETPEDCHILIAEDNELNGQILTEILREEGFRTSLAVNGQVAVDLFKASAQGEYSAILMDLRMPEKDGYEAAKEIRALPRPDAKTVRIFACTADSFQEDREKAIACGMDNFVAKPVDVKKLIMLLRS